MGIAAYIVVVRKSCWSKPTTRLAVRRITLNGQKVLAVKGSIDLLFHRHNNETGYDSVIPLEHFSQDSARHRMMQNGIRVHSGSISAMVWVADDMARRRRK